MDGRLVVLTSLLALTGATQSLLPYSIRVEHIESELEQLPKLFYLDDYERCMAKEGGIFCLGEFQLHSDTPDHPLMPIIQKYSKDSDLYNRSYLHRGYCLNTRCHGNESNLSARFETCVDKLVQRSHGLRARLRSLSYCQEYGQTPDTTDLPHRVFLYVVLVLLALNIVGTTYDLQVDEKENTGEFLRKWSIRQNWRLLIEPAHPNEEIGLDSLNGFKTFILAWTPIYCHCTIFMTAVYQFNPRSIEKFLLTIAGPGIAALTTVTQIHLIVTIFLTTYSILSSKAASLKSIPVFVVRRIVRMLPVYLLAIGFSATWWTSFGDGPMWHHLIDAESAICRRKFWVQAAFLHNIIDAKYLCNVQTWIMAVDMQIHIPVLFLAFFLRKYRDYAYWILSSMFVAMVAITAHIAFKNQYIPPYMYFDPENYRTLFRENKSFYEFFVTPLNCLMSIVIAIGAAFIHKDIKDKGIKLEGRLWEFLTYFAFIIVLLWAACASYFKRNITDPWSVVGMTTGERFYYSIVMMFMVISVINVECKLTAFMQSYIVRPISRMALGIAMVHWCVNGVLIGNRYALHESSIRVIIQDTITTFAISLFLSLPITLMVDLPMKTTLDKFVNKLNWR